MKYSDEHWNRYLGLVFAGFSGVKSVRMLCSLLNQWMTAMGRENWAQNKPEVACDDPKFDWQMKHWMKQIVHIIGPCRIALHQVVDEFISFFCLDDAVPKKAKLAFGDKTYVSDPGRLGSDYALLILRITHFMDSLNRYRNWLMWEKGISSYGLRLPEDLRDAIYLPIHDNFNAHFVVDRIEAEQPRVRITDKHHNGITCFGPEKHSAILPYWGPPKAPLCYTSQPNGPAASKRKRKHAMISTKPNGNIEVAQEQASEPAPVQFMSLRQTVKEKENDPETKRDWYPEYTIAGSLYFDVKILEFLTPRELHSVQKLNSQMHLFVELNFHYELQFAVAATKLLQDFFRNEYGRVHLLLSSWGREYQEERTVEA